MAATSGMNVYAASFLIPLGVLFYTLIGGLKATFLASYIHTAIIFVGLVLFVTWTYVINDCPDTPMGEIPEEQCNSIGSASVVRTLPQPQPHPHLTTRTSPSTPCLPWPPPLYSYSPPRPAPSPLPSTAFTSILAPDPTFAPDPTLAPDPASVQMYERLAFVSAIDSVKLGTSDTEGAHHGPAAPDDEGGSFNRGGSYLTMLSVSGLEFGVINIVGNFGTVFCDQSYWQACMRSLQPAACSLQPHACSVQRAAPRATACSPFSNQPATSFTVLAVGHRGLARLGAQGLPPGRPRLVHHPLRARHLARPRRQRAQRQARLDRGGPWPRAARGSDRHDGQGRRQA